MEIDPFRIRSHVADFDDIVEEIVALSAAARFKLAMSADIAYGNGPAETVDLFFPDDLKPGMPVHMFIHGGYWRMFSKRDYSHIADTVTRAGAIAVIVDYALMPGVRMAEIVDQVRRAKRWVTDNIAEHGGDPSRLTVSGHSAGAHLSTFLFDDTEMPSGIEAALLLGGLYDLAPLTTSFLQAEIGLTDDEVSAFTPMHRRHDAGTRAVILAGADETAPFHQQAAAFRSRLEMQGLTVIKAEIAGRNHMDSVRDLGIAGTECSAYLARLIAGYS